MNPNVHEWLAGQCLRLRDLVLVMRKDEVLAAGMNIEALAEVLHRHLRALDVPARAAGADLGLPLRLARFRRLPQREVAGVVLVVLVHVHPRAVVHAGEVLL